MSTSSERPDRDTYYMGIAMAVRRRADCRGQKVGAIVVVDNRIVSTGYNGTTTKMQNCSDGGCYRCANRDRKYESGTAYDICICVHAEQNVILAAAKFGISVQGGTVYSTTQPCFGCLKEMLQAGIVSVNYMHAWSGMRGQDQALQYKMLLDSFPNGVHKLDVPDPDAEWAKAVPARAIVADPHGIESA